jgi:hypothetical protein
MDEIEKPENKNNLFELRGHLFDVLRGLKGKSDTATLANARAVTDVAQTLINSARVEVDYIRATDRIEGSTFLESPKETQPPGVTVHHVGDGSLASSVRSLAKSPISEKPPGRRQ